MISFASDQDIDELVKLNKLEHSSTKNAASNFELFQWWGEFSLLQWHFKLLKECSGNILVARYDNKIVGELDYVTELLFPPERIHIFWLYVAPDHRRKGVGKLLIKELLKIAHSKKCEIWVEAEDFRSESLYRKLGREKLILRNYRFDFGDFIDNRFFLLSSSLPEPAISHDFSSFNLSGYYRLIGQYNVPSFDLLQLKNSIGSVAEKFIWGETLPPILLTYFFPDFTIKVILTQYLRLYSSIPQIPDYILKQILCDIVIRCFNQNFISINIQVYGGTMDKILDSLGFIEENESEDPIFCIK